MFGLCVGKKTALLQAVALACMSGLVNVQFCALALHYFVFFQSLSSKLSVRVCLFTLTANGWVYEKLGISERFIVKPNKFKYELHI